MTRQTTLPKWCSPSRGRFLPRIFSLALAALLAIGCARVGFDDSAFLPPIRFDDGHLKVSLSNASAMRMSGSCTAIGGDVTIDGDGFGIGTCGEGGKWTVTVDFTAAPEGTIVVSGVQHSTNGAFSSPPTERELTKDTGYCSQAGRIEAAPFAGGDGTEFDPYRICSKAQLLEVDSHRDAHLQLENDIDLGDEPWAPFGTLTGVFDGNDFVLQNLSYETTGNPSGLFRNASGTIQNLGLVNVKIWSYCHVGAVVGILNEGGQVSRCFSTGELHSYSDAVGGLIGENAGTVVDSFSSISVVDSRDCYIGGLVGINDPTGSIQTSYASGPIMGLGATQIGGLVGRNNGRIEDCYALGAVLGNIGASEVGGLIGQNEGMVYRSFSAGQVTGKTTGGFIGTNTGGVESSYWDIDRSQQELSSGDGTGLSSEAMRSQQSFVGWNFDTVWRLEPLSMDHPILAWQ